LPHVDYPPGQLERALANLANQGRVREMPDLKNFSASPIRKKAKGSLKKIPDLYELGGIPTAKSTPGG
jgi:hypothetical protein